MNPHYKILNSDVISTFYSPTPLHHKSFNVKHLRFSHQCRNVYYFSNVMTLGKEWLIQYVSNLKQYISSLVKCPENILTMHTLSSFLAILKKHVYYMVYIYIRKFYGHFCFYLYLCVPILIQVLYFPCNIIYYSLLMPKVYYSSNLKA